jgi:FkbM family methyltransferase
MTRISTFRSIVLFFIFLFFEDIELSPFQLSYPKKRTVNSYPDEITTYPTLMLSPQAMRCSIFEFDIRCPPPRSVTVNEGTQFFVNDYWPILSDSNEIVNYHIEKTFWDKVERNAWEPITFKVLKTVLLNNGGVEGGAEYLDFGAWIGPTVLFAAHFASRVWTLEPDTMAAEMLIANFEIPENADIRKKTSIFHECIAEKAGILKIQGLGQSGSRINRESIVKFEHEVSGGREWNIPCRSLPQFYKEEGIENLRLVKMDVEGAELTVFPSLGPWLKELDQNKSITGGKPTFWLSLHRPYWARAELSDICALWRTFSQWKFVYNDLFTDVSSDYRVNRDREKDGDHCRVVLCATFCEFLLTDTILGMSSKNLTEKEGLIQGNKRYSGR